MTVVLLCIALDVSIWCQGVGGARAAARRSVADRADRLVGRLGAGGMGKVFLGRSPGGRLVAVKVIREELAGDADFRVRFRREAAGARMVSGLFTAPVVGADLDGPVPWLATAYVAGPSLSVAVAGYGPLPVESLLALGAALAEGLGAIHAVGVVHRDLKPSNVLLAADGPRIIDFGIARAAEATALTHTGLVMGSPGYMSPEQAEGRDVGPASDVFSLGAVLTFAATGDGPFGSGSTAALIYRIVHGAPDLEKVPEPVRGVVERCLAKDPGQRPTPDRLLAELGGADLTADWLPATITREFPAAPAQRPAGTATVTSSLPGQRLDQSPLTPELKAERPPRRPRGGPEPAGSLLARLEHEDWVTALVFSPAGARMATVSGKTVRLWDKTPEEMSRLQHQGYVAGLAFSPDGTQIAVRTSGSAFGFRNPVSLWDAATGSETAQLPHRRPVATVIFSPDSTRIATSGEDDKAAGLWDPRTGREIAQLRYGSPVNRLIFSPDSKRILILSSHRKEASLWDVATGQEVTRIHHARPIQAAVFSPDGTRLVSFSEEGTTRLWDSATGREQPWDARTRLWDAATGRERRWEERMTRMPHDGTVTIMKFSPDGTRLATASSDKLVRLWDPSNGQETSSMPHGTIGMFSPDGTRFVTAGGGSTVQLLDPRTGRELARMSHDAMIRDVEFNPDGSQIAALAGKTANLWTA